MKVICILLAMLSIGEESEVPVVNDVKVSDIPPYWLDSQRACGVMSLYFLHCYWKGQLRYEDVVRICPPGSRGVSLADLSKAAAEMGYDSIAFRSHPSNLNRLRSPAIIHVHMQEHPAHFVVMLSYDPDKATFRIFDPPETVVDVPEGMLVDCFTGDGLYVSPNQLSGRTVLGPSEKMPGYFMWGIAAVNLVAICLLRNRSCRADQRLRNCSNGINNEL